MYADVKEICPGRAQKLEAKQKQCTAAAANNDLTDPAAAIVDAETSLDSLDSSCYSESQENTSSSSISSVSLPQTASMPSSNSHTQKIDMTGSNVASTERQAPAKKYLLLCINTWNRVHLEQIEVSYR